MISRHVRLALILAVSLALLFLIGCEPPDPPQVITGIEPRQICPGEQVYYYWDAVDVVQYAELRCREEPNTCLWWTVTSAPDDLIEPPGYFPTVLIRGSNSARPAQDTTFTFELDYYRGEPPIVRTHTVDVIMPGEEPVEEVDFAGQCDGSNYSWAPVDLTDLVGGCMRVDTACNTSSTPIHLNYEGGSEYLEPGECAQFAPPEPGVYSVTAIPFSAARPCTPLNQSPPEGLSARFTFSCDNSLSTCFAVTGMGGGAACSCGDNVCNPDCDEDVVSCPADCALSIQPPCDLGLTCGNGVCNASCENSDNCVADCSVLPPLLPSQLECGPGWLPASGCTCCGTTLVCSDGSMGEFNPECTGATTGGQPAVCGDTVCNGGETCWTCSKDCGPC